MTKEPALIVEGDFTPAPRLIAMVQVSPAAPTSGEFAAITLVFEFERQLPDESVNSASLYAAVFNVALVAPEMAFVATSTISAQEEILSSVVRDALAMAAALVLIHELMAFVGSF